MLGGSPTDSTGTITAQQFLAPGPPHFTSYKWRIRIANTLDYFLMASHDEGMSWEAKNNYQ